MAVGDLNRDGRSDLVVGGADRGTPGETSVLMAGPRGRLLGPQAQQLGGAGGVAIADFNGDGNRDVVRVTSHVPALGDDYGEAAVLFGDGRGAFPTRRVTPIRCCPEDIAAGTFNGDRKPDLAVLTEQGDGYVLIGDGAGGFRRRPGSVGNGSTQEVKVADLNLDRKLDLVVRNGAEEPHDVTVQLGNGQGGFSRARTLPGDAVTAFALGRFNRDRWPDIAAVGSNPDNHRGYYVRLFLGADAGRFRRAGRFSIGRYERRYISPWQIVAADLNSDRKQDLAVAGPQGSNSDGQSYTLRVLRGTGRGRFAPVRTVTRCCSSYRPLAVGFFNRDRKPDLAAVAARGTTAENYRELVSVLINNTR